ncbi:NADPH-dependent FMN reductase [Methylocystis parvus]|uniref:NAD(P)H-dependent oxidoreductase n=1 Tax=Methylocystis parvus TaxID=134 RepID=A0A6B8M6N0_9HYPH|nr:NADPH-dependent FMN reductase [Methylocystis parvus]QGM98128.1 NAD(P)H-dependent oxidoreductase [Methylocystis parvus]WBK01551.1 NAD(P)H-dependent oxidoreductase [Methylocystis parvus OBBP]
MPEASPSEDRSATLVLISGSLRARSVNGAVVATAAKLVPAGICAVIYRQLGSLPHFNPDDDNDLLPEAVAEMRAQLRSADAILFSTPEYAGSLPGSFKNLLDWTVGGSCIYRLPVGWINPSPHGGSHDAYAALRIVLGRAGADIVEAACRDIPVPRDAVDEDGFIASQEIQTGVSRVVTALAEAASARRGAAAAK